MRLSSACLTGFAVLALFLAGLFKAYPIELFCGTERTIVLDSGTHPLAHRAGLSYSVDLGKLDLQARADNAYGAPELQIKFFEDGVPLKNEPNHHEIETRPGLYSHWDHYTVFSPRSGGPPSGVYSIRYLELDRLWRWTAFFCNSNIWCWTASACLIVLTVGGVWSSYFVSRRVVALLLLGLALGITPHVVKFWDRALTFPDSDSYVLNSARPPLYPWLIRACRANAEWNDDDLRTVGVPLSSPSQALLDVIRAQRLALWIAFVLAAWGVSQLVPSPLAVLLFFVLHLNGMFQPEFECSLMSEPLAGAFLLLVTATFCAAIARGRLWPLPLLAAAYGCLVLTRSAGAFAIVFLVVAVMAASVTNWRRKALLVGSLASVGLVGFAALAALLWNSHTQNGVWALSPLQSCERMAFALQCADESDLDAMPDAEARWFLKESIRRKNELLAARGKAGAALEDFDLNLNCWFVTFPIARDMFTDNFGAASLPPRETGYGPALFAYVNDLFHRVAEVVLKRHRDRYFRIVAHSFFQLAIRDYTRLHWRSVSFLWLAALGWIACLIGRNKYALASATCMAAHLVNLVGVSCFEQPLTRYVYFSEWVCLLGFLLGVLSCGQRLIGKRMVIEQTQKEHRHADLLAA